MKTAIDEKTLKYLMDSANISSIDEVSDRLEEMRKKEYLAMHPNKITENKDGRFSTYLPDDTKPNNRRKVIKATKELLEKEIIQYYKEREKEQSIYNLCLKDFYPEWLSFKALHTTSSYYVKTIDLLWKRFYVDTPIIDVPIIELNKALLDNWAHAIIKEHSMTKKTYYNMAIIMRQALQYAVDKEIIKDSPFNYVKISGKLFAPVLKKADETQVFLKDEQPLIEREAYKDFEATNHTACLGIILAFQTGLRISELVGLKFSDIGEEIENCIHVQRMEIKEYVHNSDGTWGSPTVRITERTKSLAGTRNVYLTTQAREIIEKIKQSNIENGYDNSGYIFLNKKGRMTTMCFNDRIRRYCRNANISERGMHKIRKTYISTLIDDDAININYIRQQVGHVDERTTFSNYCYNRRSKDLTAQAMENALVHNY